MLGQKQHRWRLLTTSQPDLCRKALSSLRLPWHHPRTSDVPHGQPVIDQTSSMAANSRVVDLSEDLVEPANNMPANPMQRGRQLLVPCLVATDSSLSKTLTPLTPLPWTSVAADLDSHKGGNLCH